jgi:hypothetical protein
MYVLRNGTYFDFKYILRNVGKFGINLGRGGGQKSHIVSPLDFRLSSYLMAMCDFNFKLFNSFNMFNTLPKNKYLPFIKVKKEN